MIKFNIVELLNKNNKTKYWLCQRMDMTSRNLNRLINGDTTAISFKYLENLCQLLNCDFNELMTIMPEKNFINDKVKLIFK